MLRWSSGWQRPAPMCGDSVLGVCVAATSCLVASLCEIGRAGPHATLAGSSMLRRLLRVAGLLLVPVARVGARQENRRMSGDDIGNTRQQVAAELKRVRQAAGLSQEQMAERLGM